VRLTLGSVDVDLLARQARADGEVVELTALEARLLRYLASRPDTDVPRSELLEQVWGYSPTTSTRAVDFVVSRLRSKLGAGGRSHLLTVHGVGYRLVGGSDGLRLPPGVVDLDQRRFVPDGGEPVELSGQEMELLVRFSARVARP
jgi:hypothetical protein